MVISFISLLISAVYIIKYFNLYNKYHKLKEKNKALTIVYDDYSAYIKSYVEFYKWLKLMYKDQSKIVSKYKEVFKHCEND